MSKISESLKQRAVQYWESGELTKTQIASLFGISVRTLGRAIEKYGTKQQEPAKEEPQPIQIKSVSKTQIAEAIEEVTSAETPKYEYHYLITGGQITVSRMGDGDPQHSSITKTEDPDTFKEVLNLIIDDENPAAAWGKLNEEKAILGEIAAYVDGALTIDGGVVYVGGHRIQSGMCEVLINMYNTNDIRLQATGKFFLSLMTASNYTALEGLFDFLGKNGIDINEDGSFYAYKAVRHNYLDKYSGTIDNSIGKQPVMPRHMVSEDRTEACAPGLHVGSLEYVRWYQREGDRIVKCLCWPRDVVRVPYDHDATKAALTTYLVVEDVTDWFRNEYI